MSENSPSIEDLLKELGYYKKQLDRISGESIKNDFALSSLRYELNQKKDALDILTSLQQEFSITDSLEEVFHLTVKAICRRLRMDRAVVFLPGSTRETFMPTIRSGYQNEAFFPPETESIAIDLGLFSHGKYLLLNRSIQPDGLCKKIQETVMITYFVGVPMITDGQIGAVLVAGRQFEKTPFAPPLNKGDADTLTAIAGLINTIVESRKMAELKIQKQAVEKQKDEVTSERNMLERTLDALRRTQAQLIQSEKMASLGELTTGIAHEIQNPLNFVNNFSDINSELIAEMKQEIANGNLQDAKTIANSIDENEQKINFHGKRADAIVKAMLQHSRLSTGQKEPTDINALIDEFLRLAFHGLRAKDNSFNATINTNFDSSIAKIDIIPQDIGRVILNLYNNAFYAVAERKKQVPEEYEPTVSVITKNLGGKIEIRVKDNGNGIPQKVVGKIFQPFFTTKPTGQGTGLGLSLSYDIIKAHGGEIIVNTKEGEFTEFMIQLPA